MMWIFYKLLKVLKIKNNKKIELLNNNHILFDSRKSLSNCETWVLTNEKYYYYDGYNYKHLNAILYENKPITDSSVEYHSTPMGFEFYPYNIFTKTHDNKVVRVTKKMKMIL